MQNITILNIETVIKAIEREIGSDKIIMSVEGNNVMFVSLLGNAYSTLLYLEVVNMKLRTRGLRMLPTRRVTDDIFMFTVSGNPSPREDATDRLIK